MDPNCNYNCEQKSRLKAPPRRRTGPLSLKSLGIIKIGVPIVLFCAILMAGMMPHIAASSIRPGIPAASGGRPVGTPRPMAAGDTCATATVINPAALPFFDEGTNVGAANDIDPTGGCAPGPGADVVYSFTPTVTDVYTIGA